jgi:predicted RNase H-like nuclease
MSSRDTHFVGIDLAWGERRATGLAVVDASGQLVSSATFKTDDDIAAWLDTSAPNPLVVAVDAPLIVPNHTVQRVPETLIGRAFGKYGASAHTSNRSNTHFNPPRAETLARRLGWTTDPGTATGEDVPVCIEVYPHPALVGLFKLPRRILYKKGRERQAGFELLATCLESVPELRLAESTRWYEIRRVITSPRPGDLHRIEDEIDAILCAHRAWLWHHRPGALQVYGSADVGYIVAPPPPTHPALPRDPFPTSR